MPETQHVMKHISKIVIALALARQLALNAEPLEKDTGGPAQSATPLKTLDEIRTELGDPVAVAERRRLDEPKWTYSDVNDPMGRGVTKLAEVESNNTVDFGFPYNGAQHATLVLQKGPSAYRKGAVEKQIVLKLERGQLLFHYIQYGAVQNLAVRFDSGKVQTSFIGLQLADGGTNRMGIIPYDEFTAQIRKANKVAIEATFFQEGTRVFEFDIQGLARDW